MGPDGCLYVVDVYHGITQHIRHLSDYLRPQILDRSLNKGNRSGRNYRIVPEGRDVPREKPRMLVQTSAELVWHLSHRNGWWRDTAQRLLVQRRDESVVPMLESIVVESDNHLAKIQALWTLQGLGVLNQAPLAAARADKHPKVVRTGELLSEPLVKFKEEQIESNAGNLSEADRKLYHIGKAVYEQTCFGCHQSFRGTTAKRRSNDRGDRGLP